MASALLLGGCIFSPNKGSGGGPPPPPKYLPPIRPEFVLNNLREAYNAKDSTTYKSVFDENYQATFIDQKDPSPQLVTYYKESEAQHIAFLAKSFANVDMQLTPNLLFYQDLGDPPGWRTVQNPFASLEVTVDSTRQVDIAQDTIEMRFIPTTPDASSPTDTTWRIIRLTEIRR